MSVPEQAGPSARDAPAPPEAIVLDASVAVDLLAGTELATAATVRLRGTTLHAPAHLCAEVLSALGRLHRDGTLEDEEVAVALHRLSTMPVTEHPVPALLDGAWRRRGRLRLLDALYVELADQLDTVVVTTDHRLARAETARAEAIRSS